MRLLLLSGLLLFCRSLTAEDWRVVLESKGLTLSVDLDMEVKKVGGFFVAISKSRISYASGARSIHIDYFRKVGESWEQAKKSVQHFGPNGEVLINDVEDDKKLKWEAFPMPVTDPTFKMIIEKAERILSMRR